MAGGGFMYNINEISLSFKFRGQKSENELRQLLVEITNNFLERINSNTEIRNSLIEFPFPVKRIDFRITNLTNNKRPINKGSSKEILSDIMLFRGMVGYEFKNEERKSIQTLFEEPYEEAQKIVKKQRPDLFQ